MITVRREREGRQRELVNTGECVSVFLTFTGGHLAFQLVVPVSFGWQWRLGVFVIQAIQAAFGLQRGDQSVKSIENKWGNNE